MTDQKTSVFSETLFGENSDFDLTRFSNEGDAEVCQVIDQLAAPWKISTERDFDIGKGIPERDQTISQKIHARKIGVGENFGAGGSLENEGAGNTGLAAGMADVRLVVESRDGVRKRARYITQQKNRMLSNLLIAGLQGGWCRIQNGQGFTNQEQ